MPLQIGNFAIDFHFSREDRQTFGFKKPTMVRCMGLNFWIGYLVIMTIDAQKGYYKVPIQVHGMKRWYPDTGRIVSPR